MRLTTCQQVALSKPLGLRCRTKLTLAPQGLDRSQRRLEGHRRGEGKLVEGPVDMGMTIACAGRKRPACGFGLTALGEVHGVGVGGASRPSALSIR